MHALALISSILVGAAFVAAGVFKLLDGPAWPKQAADMGVSRSVALVVPWVELVLGVASIVVILLPWSAVAAIAVLVVFTAVIVRRLLDGSRPPCACFGSRSSRPLGPVHVVRNVVLLVLASIAAIWG
jgi:Methylamine utilisation protein MauE